MAAFSGITDILHPMTVHFPIALIIVSCLLAFIHLIRTKDIMMNGCIRFLVVLAALGAWAAVITGSYHLALSAEGEAIKHIHHNFATWTAWAISVSAAIYILMTFMRKMPPLWLGLLAFILLLISIVLISFTGFFAVSTVLYLFL